MKNNSKAKKNSRKTIRKNNRKSKRGGARELIGSKFVDTKDFINRYMFKYNDMLNSQEKNLEVFTHEIKNNILQDLENKNNILYVIDMQNDFIDRPIKPNNDGEELTGPNLGKGPIGAFAVNNGSTLINELIKFLDLNKDRFNKIIFTRDFHDKYHCSFFTQTNGPFPPHCVIGTVGSGLVKEIKDWINVNNKDKIEILFKGMHPKQDSFGAVEYSEKHISKRQVGECTKKKTKQGNGNNVNSSCSIFTGCKKLKENDISRSMEDNLFKGQLWSEICENFVDYNIENNILNDDTNIYVCGLAGDFCVRDTALNFSDKIKENSNINVNVKVIHDLTRNAFIPISIPQPSYPFVQTERYGGLPQKCKFVENNKLTNDVTEINKEKEKELYNYVFLKEQGRTSILSKNQLDKLKDLEFELGTYPQYNHFLTDHRQILHDYSNANVKLITDKQNYDKYTTRVNVFKNPNARINSIELIENEKPKSSRHFDDFKPNKGGNRKQNKKSNKKSNRKSNKKLSKKK